MNDEAEDWGGPVLPPSPAELADRYAIAQLPKIYGLGLDLRDYELCRSAFAPDATAQGKNGMEPIDTYLPATYRTASSFHATQHVISNQYITIKGDEAVLWSYGVAHHKVVPGTQDNEIIAGVQYRNRCRRFPDGWLIIEHSVALQWMDRGPPRIPA
jgi:hypothetical protein